MKYFCKHCKEDYLVHKECGGKVLKSKEKSMLNGHESKCNKCGEKWWSYNDSQCTVLKSEFF
jgi:hypothetical protein